MHRIPFLRLLLSPSFCSGAVVLLVAIGILGYSGWLYISNNLIFYNYLFSAYGLYNYLWQGTRAVSDWYTVFLSSSTAYYLLVGGVAVCMGLAVFTVLQIGSLLLRGSVLLWQEAHLSGATHRQTTRLLLSRLGLRMLAVIGWAVYGAVFVSSILPAALVGNQAGIELLRGGQWSGAGLCAAVFVGFCLALHLHVVFARLAMLRLRVFGGSQAIEAARAHTSV